MEKATAFTTTGRIAVLCLVGLVSTPPAWADAAVTMRMVRGHWVVVPVRIDGQGPFEFLLDTGANVSMITPTLAGRIGLRPTARVVLQTVAGSRVAPYSVVSGVAVGSAEVGHLEVVHIDLPDIRALDDRIEGILGQNFWAQFNYTLDYRRGRLEFARDGSPGRGERLTVEREDGRLIVRARGAAGARPLRLVLDSGVSRLVLFPGGARAVELEWSEDSVTGSTSLGERTLRPARVRALALGGARLANVPAAVAAGADEPGGDGAFSDGLLPTSLFDSVFFDNRQGFVVVRGPAGLGAR